MVHHRPVHRRRIGVIHYQCVGLIDIPDLRRLALSPICQLPHFTGEFILLEYGGQLTLETGGYFLLEDAN